MHQILIDEGEVKNIIFFNKIFFSGAKVVRCVSVLRWRREETRAKWSHMLTSCRLPAIVNIVSCLINLFSSIFLGLHVVFLVLASLILSLFGEVPAFITLCCAYISSATTTGDRTLAIAMTITSVEIGLATGSLIGNFLTRYFGYSIAFIFIEATLGPACQFTTCIIPHTIP